MDDSHATAIRSATAPALRVRAGSSVQPATEPDVRWDPLLLAVAAYLLISVGRVHQLFPALAAFRPAILSGIAAILLYLIDSHHRRRSRDLLVPTTLYLVALLIWAALSAPGSLWPGNSLDLVVNNFAKTVIMFVVVVGSVRGVRDAERLAGAYFLSVALYAAVVMWRFDVGTGTDWRLGSLYYYDANDFATLAVTTMPLGLYFLHTAGRPFRRLLAGLGLLVLMVTFVRSGSRGGFIALLAIAGFVLLRYRAIPFRWRVSAVALAALVFVGTASDQYWNQMRSILSDADYNRTEETGRLQVWRRGVGYMLDYPVFGVGPNNFPVAEGTLSPLAERQQLGIGVRWNAAHNTFIQAGAELGIPGLLLFVAMIGSALGALRRLQRVRGAPANARPTPRLALALTASVIGFVVGAFFLSLAYSEMLYTLLALSIGLEKIAAAEAR